MGDGARFGRAVPEAMVCERRVLRGVRSTIGVFGGVRTPDVRSIGAAIPDVVLIGGTCG